MEALQPQHGLDQRADYIDKFEPFAPKTFPSPRTSEERAETLKNLSNMIQDSNGEEAQSNVKAQALPTPLDMCPLFSYSGSNALLPLPCEKVSLKSQHPPNKAHKCKHCEFETITYVELKRHSKVHCENEPSKVKNFESQLLSPSNFVYRTQNGKMFFKCNFCQYTTPRKDNIIPHVRTHTGEKPFKCRLCPYKAAQKSMVKIHERTHTQEKPFKCDFCSYSTSQDGHLKRHLISHTGLTIYKCQFCSYFTSRQENLKRHEARHTGVKPFKCKHCSYTSTQKIRVKIHERIHTGEKPHKCQQCPYSTNRDSNLRRHLKTHVNDADCE